MNHYICKNLDEMIIRPSQGNRSRGVENEEIREIIRKVVDKFMA